MTISPQKVSGRLGLKLVSGFPANNELATHYQTQHSLPFTILTSRKFHSFPTISVAAVSIMKHHFHTFIGNNNVSVLIIEGSNPNLV